MNPLRKYIEKQTPLRKVQNGELGACFQVAGRYWWDIRAVTNPSGRAAGWDGLEPQNAGKFRSGPEKVLEGSKIILAGRFKNCVLRACSQLVGRYGWGLVR